MSTPIWFVNLLKSIYPARRPIAWLTRLPLIGELVDHVVFRGDEMYILPRDRTLTINQPLDPPTSTVLPSRVVEHAIENASHHWIMDFCLCREGDGCHTYPQDLGCIFLGEPVTRINSELGRLVSKEEALEHARRCREAGLVHAVGRNRLDSIWLGTGPAEDLMTICNCCPCCCLWGLVNDLTPRISDKIAAMPGVMVRVSELCLGCGDCQEEVCFAEAISLENGRAQIGGACRGCGRCVDICPEGAITLTIDNPDQLQNVISRLDRLRENS